jgi:hypothetical protein
VTAGEPCTGDPTVFSGDTGRTGYMCVEGQGADEKPMSVTQDAAEGGSNREEFPAVELECLLDDWEAPGEVTVFADEGADGEWLTIDAEHAIDVDVIP